VEGLGMIHELSLPLPSTGAVSLFAALMRQGIQYSGSSFSVKAPISLSQSTFGVTENLFAALRSLRREIAARRIWIDAICLYVDRYQRKYHINLRFGPLFSEGFRFCKSDQPIPSKSISKANHGVIV
jgi:hypothetical protein